MSTRTDDFRTDPQNRADARANPLQAAYERNWRASQDAWRQPSPDMQRTDAVRDATGDDGLRDEAETRIDAGASAAECARQLNAARDRNSAWALRAHKNNGDDPRVKVPPGDSRRTFRHGERRSCTHCTDPVLDGRGEVMQARVRECAVSA